MKICIPIKCHGLKEAAERVKKAKKEADFIEIWLDGFREAEMGADFRKLVKVAGKPVIAVCKALEERGTFCWGETARVEMLVNAVEAGAGFADIGIHTAPKLIALLRKACKKNKAKLIISEHFWKDTPELEELEKRVREAKKLGADVVKIATMVKNFSDNVRLFELTRRAAQEGVKIIVVGMGEKGRLSRIGCPILGSELTYAALDKKSLTADGQMTVKEMRNFNK